MQKTHGQTALPLALFLGGTRSGKSALAEEYATWLVAEHGFSDSQVLYVATAEACDDSMQRRIEQHQKRRPQDWQNLEIPYNLAQSLTQYLRKSTTQNQPKIILIDCMTLCISNILFQCGHDIDAQKYEATCKAEIVELLALIKQNQSIQWLMVSGETGLGGIGASHLERLFQDALGLANQLIADAAVQSFFCVAGRALPLAIERPWQKA